MRRGVDGAQLLLKRSICDASAVRVAALELHLVNW
jgi:hypothetical protein